MSIETYEQMLEVDEFSNRGDVRKVGVYGNKGYRQLFIKNWSTKELLTNNNNVITVMK